MNLIRIDHLRKEFPRSVPLKDINAEIRQGDVIAVIGPSGSGKSTLLRCLNRLETPTGGSILVNGEDITDPKCNVTKMRRKIGMVFQSFNLFNNLNVIDNVTSAPVHLLKIPRKEAYRRGMQLLEQVGMAERADRFPDELSGGQKQRVAIARAIAMDPMILLFDEPTSALDPAMVHEVLSVIRKLADDGMTMIIVTHEMQFARDVATRVFYLDDGIIYEEGTPEEIFDHPQKEKTRRFVRRLKSIEIDISSPEVDFPEIVRKIEEFGENTGLTSHMLRRLMLSFEELVIQIILRHLTETGKGFPVMAKIEHSEADETIKMDIQYGGDYFDPVRSGDTLSVLLLEKMTSKLTFRYEDTNRVIAVL